MNMEQTTTTCKSVEPATLTPGTLISVVFAPDVENDIDAMPPIDQAIVIKDHGDYIEIEEVEGEDAYERCIWRNEIASIEVKMVVTGVEAEGMEVAGYE